MPLFRRRISPERELANLRRGIISPAPQERALGANNYAPVASAKLIEGQQHAFGAQPKKVRAQDKFEVLLDRFLNTLVAQNTVQRKMNLLKTNRARLVYLQKILEFAKGRETLRESLSRRIEAANKSKDTKYARFLTKLSRSLGEGKSTLVPRELELELMQTKADVEKKQEPKEAFVKRMKAGKGKQSIRKEKIIVRYLDKLKKSPSYAAKSADEKIAYLKNILANRSRDKIGRASTSILEKEISLLEKQKNKDSAKQYKAAAENSEALIREALRSSNPELRRKLVRKARRLSKEKGEKLPYYVDYVTKYGYLNGNELGRIYNFEEAKAKGDYARAGKELNGARFVFEANSYYGKLLRKNPLQAGLFLIANGQIRRANALANQLEKTETSANVMAALKIRQRMQKI